MKDTVILRTVDEVGRIVIPSELRKALDIDNRDSVEIALDGDKMILKKHQPSCVFCGETENITSYKNKIVCRDCIKGLSKIK